MSRSDKMLINEDQVQLVREWAGYGLTVGQMAAMLGMSKDTFERRVKEDNCLSAALEKGRANAIIDVSKSAYGQATSGKTPAMTMFWLKCRAGWKESEEIQIKPIELKYSLTKEEPNEPSAESETE